MKHLGLGESGAGQTRATRSDSAQFNETYFGKIVRLRRAMTAPAAVLALCVLSACAPKPPVVEQAACPEPVMSHAKDGTLITLSEPCVLPERFEVVEPISSNLSDSGDSDGGGDDNGGPVDPVDPPPFETKKEALKRVYGTKDWHNIDGEEAVKVREYYLENRKTGNNWYDYGRDEDTAPTPGTED